MIGLEQNDSHMTDQKSNINTSGTGKDSVVPDEIKGWCWGGFCLNWLWAIFNNTWIGLLVFTPYIGFIMCFVLGIKGREWAWRNKKWQSVEHFNSVQRKWSIAALLFFLGSILLGVIFIALLIIFDVSFVTR